MKTLIKGGSVVFKDCVKKSDILTENGKIIAIGEEISGADEIIDARGKTVIPGIIDMHVHLREPGFDGKEDIASGSLAAVAGGVTQVCCMPNTNPVCDNAVVVGYIINRAKEVGLCKVRPIGAITRGEGGESLSDIGKMAKAGAVALSDDGKSVMNSNIMRLGMEYASDFGLKCLCHCEDITLVDGGVVNEGYNSTLCGLKGQPRAVEDIMISRDICLAQSLNLPVHICHVSTYSGVEIIRAAKKSGVQVTAETCPHYFMMTHEELKKQDADYRMNPPLRTEDDRQAMIEGLLDGTLDAIATDHAPHTPEEKADFRKSPNGSIGMETSLAASITQLVETGCLTLSQLIEKMSVNPAKILKIPAGVLEEDGCADIVLFDPKEQWVVDENALHGKSKNTPFKGMTLTGKVKITICGGKVVYEG